MARHEIRYTFDRDFIQRALRRDVMWLGVYGALVMIGATALIEFVYGAYSHAITAVGAIGVVVIFLTAYLKLRTAATRVDQLWLNQSPDRTITMRLDDEGFDVLTAKSEARYEWKGLRRLWRYPDVWAIEIVKRFSVFFPPDQASDEARDFIVERCRDAGVRV